MSITGKIPKLVQKPILWAASAGVILSLLVSVYVSSRIRLTLAHGVLLHFKNQAIVDSTPAEMSKKRMDMNRLATLSIWGGGNREIVAPSQGLTGSSIPFTQPLDVTSLELKGIVRFPDGTFEGVFTDRHMKRSIIVKQGEVIGGIRILKIQTDRVIVSTKGKQMSFVLFKEGEKSHRTGPAERLASSLEGSADRYVVLPKEEVKAALSNMATFLRQVRIVPYLEDGKPRGFQLFDIVPGSIVSRVGLRNGDVVERVNGREIHTPRDAMQFFSMLQSGKGVTLKVKRKNRYATIVIGMK